ncbi:MAG: DnaJ domain-containing protein [Sulfurospirillum sp.]|nr:DnaJ domain-containing protein [Sulfurospirillum sp.]
MQVSFSHDMISISISEDTKTYYYLQNLTEKNFTKKIGRKNKTIVFKQEDESVQRRYFLNLVSKIYAKKHPRNFKKMCKEIRNSIDKTIKISLLQSNQILQQLNIRVIIEDNYAIILDIGSKNSLMVAYLKNYFKDHLIKYKLRDHTVSIYPNSLKTAQLLEQLLSQSELLGCFVTFIYDAQQIIIFKEVLTQKIRRSKPFGGILGLLQEYYEVLGCRIDESFTTIRKQYLKLAKQYHPDTNNFQDGVMANQYREKFELIQNAYEMIKIHFEHQKSA